MTPFLPTPQAELHSTRLAVPGVLWLHVITGIVRGSFLPRGSGLVALNWIILVSLGTSCSRYGAGNEPE
jgi:hypothetical protein